MTEVLVPAMIVVDVCNLKPDKGPCKAYMPYWYYDYTTGECKIFYYGGCLGNQNRFKTKEECERACGKYCN